jgi:hypothetical protein
VYPAIVYGRLVAQDHFPSFTNMYDPFSRIVFQVFSAFGFVHKIATFEKAAGFQVSSYFIFLKYLIITKDKALILNFPTGSDPVY